MSGCYICERLGAPEGRRVSDDEQDRLALELGRFLSAAHPGS